MEDYRIDHWTRDWLIEMGVGENVVAYFTLGIDILIVLVISFIADKIAKSILLSFIERIVRKTRTQLDDILQEKKVFNALAHIAPALVLLYSAPIIFSDFTSVSSIVTLVAKVYIVAIIMAVITRLTNAIEHYLAKKEYFRDKPIASYSQLVKIINYIVGGIIIFSLFTGVKILPILTTMGAFTAVVLLIFRDTILGFVASIQMSANDMVRVGDWVSMPKYGADGDVITITLNTVKVKNWDNTVTTIPTYAFISDSFTNWRGMSDTGARRIKRAIHIKISTIQFCNDEMLEKYSKYQLIKEYLEKKKDEVKEYNAEHKFDKSELINGRNLTNVGLFRIYTENYLKKNPNISEELTLMVRQLESTPTGLPLEVYCFSKDIRWVNYERIQSDLFDHLLAAAKNFDLEVFENPTGADFQKIVN